MSIYRMEDNQWRPGFASAACGDGVGKAVFNLGKGLLFTITSYPNGEKEMLITGFRHIEGVQFVDELNTALQSGSDLEAVFERWRA